MVCEYEKNIELFSAVDAFIVHNADLCLILCAKIS